jgi:tetratricopeptide (TPR) repeat protein
MASGGVMAQQLSYKLVDSTSFALYENKEWDQLIVFGNEAINQDFDFYYLNLRMGIAWFNQGYYYKAEKYFNKALKQDKTSPVANEYLYIIKSVINRQISADINFNRLPDSVKFRLSKLKHYYNPELYVEGGMKISSNKNIEANEPLARLIIEQKIIRRFNLQISASYIGQQNAPWGFYNQFEIGLMPSFSLTKNINLNLGWRYINVQKDFKVNITQNFIDTAATETILGPAIIITDSTENYSNTSDFMTQINTFYAGLTIYQNRFSFSVSGLFYIQNIDVTSQQIFDTSVDKTWILTDNDSIIFDDTFSGSISPTVNSNTTSYFYQAMVGATYTLPVLKNGLIIGLDAFVPLNEELSNTIWIPSLKIRIFKTLWFYGEWLQKKRVPLLYQNGNIFLNQSYQLNHRITLGLTYEFNNKFQLYFTYLNEDKYYFADNIKNTFNAAIFGINFKF